MNKTKEKIKKGKMLVTNLQKLLDGEMDEGPSHTVNHRYIKFDFHGPSPSPFLISNTMAIPLKYGLLMLLKQPPHIVHFRHSVING